MRRRKIEKIPSAVATLSRRAEYLERKLDEHMGAERHREFDQRELNSLRIALDAMSLAQLFQRVESDPIALLEEMLDAVDLFRQLYTGPHVDHEPLEQDRAEALGNLLEVQARAKSTIALADAFLDGEPL